jgi:hypothetical protein
LFNDWCLQVVCKLLLCKEENPADIGAKGISDNCIRFLERKLGIVHDSKEFRSHDLTTMSTSATRRDYKVGKLSIAN